MNQKPDEDMTAFTMRRVANEIIEKCADLAQQKGIELGEAAVGRFIADAIRESADRS